MPSMAYHCLFTKDMQFNKKASDIATILRYFISSGREIKIYGKALMLNEYDDEMKDITIEKLNDLLSKTINIINLLYDTNYDKELFLIE